MTLEACSSPCGSIGSEAQFYTVKDVLGGILQRRQYLWQDAMVSDELLGHACQADERSQVSAPAVDPEFTHIA